MDTMFNRWARGVQNGNRIRLALEAKDAESKAAAQVRAALERAAGLALRPATNRADSARRAAGLFGAYKVACAPADTAKQAPELVRSVFLRLAKEQLEREVQHFWGEKPVLLKLGADSLLLWSRFVENKALAAVLRDKAAHVAQPDRQISFDVQNALNAPVSFSTPGLGLPPPSPVATQGSSRPRQSTGSLQSDIVVGTADFLADRLKQEVNAAFFQHFAALLHDTTYVELQLLFPSTARLLTSGTADYGTLVQTLRGTFEHDLRELLFSYSEMLRTQKFYQRQLREASTSGQVLRYSYVATRAVHYLAHGTHPADLISYLQNDVTTAFAAEINASKYPIQEALQVSKVLSDALLDDGSLTRAWQLRATLTPLLTEAQTQRFFTGLVWQRVSRLPFVASLGPVPLPAHPYFKLMHERGGEKFREVALGFVNLSTELEQQVQRLKAPTDAAGATSRLRADDFVPLYQTVQQSLDFVAGNILPVSSKTQQFLAVLPTLNKVSRALLEGYVAADRGDYGVTISNFLEVVLLTLSPVSTAPTAGTKTTDPAELVAQLSATQAADTRLRSLPQIVRYGGFMAALAQAKNPDDVRAALEAAALPVGSSSVKRRSFSSLTLNAFGGVTGGLERTSVPADAAAVVPSTPWRSNVGFSAPIGLAFSWGWRGAAQQARLNALQHPTSGRYAKRLGRVDQAYRYYNATGQESYLTGSAFSLFVSVVDLGVPVLLRLKDSQTSTVPQNVDFRHVFAPGVFAIHGFRNTPISVFAGAQFTPQLRQLDTTGLKTAGSAPFLNSMRFNAGVTIDIPIITLFNRTESRQPTPGARRVERQQRYDRLELVTLGYLMAVPDEQARLQKFISSVEALKAKAKALPVGYGALGTQVITYQKRVKAVHDLLDEASKAAQKQDFAQAAHKRMQAEKALNEALQPLNEAAARMRGTSPAKMSTPTPELPDIIKEFEQAPK
ncbi:hypothetical protein [Hymenobacter ruricola]|uniref:Uncharacterized protein n=1 Tax=Hymenobacter ruricola TaxID=2791023 RepID=A0ABS0I6P5_9BACT|nr:hypothetical protein [Hymenobacter ruricola]MBF9222577.1 hypothetical protein [Hymenobacter ruricola]